VIFGLQKYRDIILSKHSPLVNDGLVIRATTLHTYINTCIQFQTLESHNAKIKVVDIIM
jgi:hypothetical protein